MWYKYSAKTKTYLYNKKEKSLQEHLEDIFPFANSVDIFYMVNRVRKKAKSSGLDVVDVLYYVDKHNLFKDQEKNR
jgi:hypothetical protein